MLVFEQGKEVNWSVISDTCDFHWGDLIPFSYLYLVPDERFIVDNWRYSGNEYTMQTGAGIAVQCPHRHPESPEFDHHFDITSYVNIRVPIDTETIEAYGGASSDAIIDIHAYHEGDEHSSDIYMTVIDKHDEVVFDGWLTGTTPILGLVFDHKWLEAEVTLSAECVEHEGNHTGEESFLVGKKDSLTINIELEDDEPPVTTTTTGTTTTTTTVSNGGAGSEEPPDCMGPACDELASAPVYEGVPVVEADLSVEIFECTPASPLDTYLMVIGIILIIVGTTRMFGVI